MTHSHINSIRLSDLRTELLDYVPDWLNVSMKSAEIGDILLYHRDVNQFFRFTELNASSDGIAVRAEGILDRTVKADLDRWTAFFIEEQTELVLRGFLGVNGSLFDLSSFGRPVAFFKDYAALGKKADYYRLKEWVKEGCCSYGYLTYHDYRDVYRYLVTLSKFFRHRT